MKMATAREIMDADSYMVSFEKRVGCMLHSDYFPDKYAGEQLIIGLENACRLAQEFANTAPPDYINIYVVRGDFTPVDGYAKRIFRKYPT